VEKNHDRRRGKSVAPQSAFCRSIEVGWGLAARLSKKAPSFDNRRPSSNSASTAYPRRLLAPKSSRTWYLGNRKYVLQQSVPPHSGGDDL
jgi:hypothetical protein